MYGAEKTRCIICKKEYLKATIIRDRHPVGIRGFNTKTCSKKCSRIYSSPKYQYKIKLERRKNGIHK